MYGIMLIVVLVLTGGVIAFIGDRLGSKVGKKKLSLFGMRPKHTSILVTIVTGILITTVTFGVLAIASENVRTALFGMEKLRKEMQATQEDLDEATVSLETMKQDLTFTKDEYDKSKKELEKSQSELEKAQSSAEELKRQQEQLQARNYQLLADNEQLIGNNSQLAQENSDLLADNDILTANNQSLKTDNASLEKLNSDLQEGIENIRERPIVYRVGELLASGIIKKTDSPGQIQHDLNQIVALANSKIVDRLGEEEAKNGVWIYPAEYEEAVKTLMHADRDMVVRLIVAANLVKGDAVLTDLELHPNRMVYQKDELVYQKVYDISVDGINTEYLIGDFLRNVNKTATSNGILPNPLTGAVGIISGNQIYSIDKALQNSSGNILVSAYAVQNTDILGPLRLNIVLHQEDDKNE